MASVVVNITPVNEPVLNDGAHQLKFSANVAWAGVSPGSYRYKVFRGNSSGTLLFDSGTLAVPNGTQTTTWPQMAYTIPAAETVGNHVIVFRLFSPTALDWDFDYVATSEPLFQVAAKGSTTASVATARKRLNNGNDSVDVTATSTFSGTAIKRRLRLVNSASSVISETFTNVSVASGAAATHSVPIPSGLAPGNYTVEVAHYTAPSCLDGATCAMPAQTANYDSVGSTATFQVIAPGVITQANPTFSAGSISLSGGSVSFTSTPARRVFTVKGPTGAVVGAPVTDTMTGATSPAAYTKTLSVPAASARGAHTVTIDYFSTESDAINATVPEATVTRSVTVPFATVPTPTVTAKTLNKTGTRITYAGSVSGWTSTPTRVNVRLRLQGSATTTLVNTHTIAANATSPFSFTSTFLVGGLAPGNYEVLVEFVSSAGNPEIASAVAAVIIVAPGTAAVAPASTTAASGTSGMDYSFTLTYASTAIRADVVASNVDTGATVAVSSVSLPGSASPQTVSGTWTPAAGTPSGRYQLVCSFYSQES